MNAYAQLAAEGYLIVRRGSRPTVSDAAAPGSTAGAPSPRPRPPRFDFRPGVPDVSSFPRPVWARSVRRALAAMADADLGYGDPGGADRLRTALAEYLGRVRGVVAQPASVVVTSGYAQGEGLVCRALAAAGARRIGVENPSHPEQRSTAARAGLELVPIGVDEDGLLVDELRRVEVDAVMVTPAHQFPTGAVLSAERRAALLGWLRERDTIAIEDDYDAEYRYDRPAVGALQGLEPDRVVYAGSASKTLAPGLRLGWLVVPAQVLEAVTQEKRNADLSTAHIEQHAFADFLARGELDRHLRRMRSRYRRRRDVLAAALAETLPEAEIQGIAAGLHVTVRLPEDDDEQAIGEEAGRRRIALATMGDYAMEDDGRPPTLLLGYGQLPEPGIRPGVNALAEAVRATRARPDLG